MQVIFKANILHDKYESFSITDSSNLTYELFSLRLILFSIIIKREKMLISGIEHQSDFYILI